MVNPAGHHPRVDTLYEPPNYQQTVLEDAQELFQPTPELSRCLEFKRIIIRELLQKDPEVRMRWMSPSQDAAQLVAMEMENGIDGDALKDVASDWTHTEKHGYIAVKNYDVREKDVEDLGGWIADVRSPDSPKISDYLNRVLSPRNAARQELKKMADNGFIVSGLLWEHRGNCRRIVRSSVGHHYKHWKSDIEAQMVDHLQEFVQKPSSSSEGVIYVANDQHDELSKTLMRKNFHIASNDDVSKMQSQGILQKTEFSPKQILLRWKRSWDVHTKERQSA